MKLFNKGSTVMNKKESVSLLKESVKEWNKYRIDNPKFIPDLSHANLSNTIGDF